MTAWRQGTVMVAHSVLVCFGLAVAHEDELGHVLNVVEFIEAMRKVISTNV